MFINGNRPIFVASIEPYGDILIEKQYNIYKLKSFLNG